MIASLTVAVGLLPMPGEYYGLVRILLCGVSLYYVSQPTGVSDGEKWLLVALAILHNPIAPVALDDTRVWAVANIGTVACFWVVHWRAMRTSGR